MANIFTDPLESICFDDVEAWASQSPPPTESERLDFKQDFGKSVTESIVAMANHDGGVIVIGAEETSARPDQPKAIRWPPVGVRLETWHDRFTEACYQQIQPAYRPEARALTIPETDRGIILVRVQPESAPRPLFHYQKGVLWRIGDHNRPANLEILRRLFQEDGTASESVWSHFDALRSHIGAASVGGSWVGAVAGFPWSASAFDSAAKRQLMNALLSWFFRSPGTTPRYPYEVRSNAGFLELNTDVDGTHNREAPYTRFRFYSRGIVALQVHKVQDPVPLLWVLAYVTRWFAMLCEDETVRRIFPGEHGLRVQLSVSH